MGYFFRFFYIKKIHYTMEALMGYFLGFLQLKKIHYIYASIIDVSS